MTGKRIQSSMVLHHHLCLNEMTTQAMRIVHLFVPEAQVCFSQRMTYFRKQTHHFADSSLCLQFTIFNLPISDLNRLNVSFDSTIEN